VKARLNIKPSSTSSSPATTPPEAKCVRPSAITGRPDPCDRRCRRGRPRALRGTPRVEADGRAATGSRSAFSSCSVSTRAGMNTPRSLLSRHPDHAARSQAAFTILILAGVIVLLVVLCVTSGTTH
jgi:hypothetical protein